MCIVSLIMNEKCGERKGTTYRRGGAAVRRSPGVTQSGLLYDMYEIILTFVTLGTINPLIYTRQIERGRRLL